MLARPQGGPQVVARSPLKNVAPKKDPTWQQQVDQMYAAFLPRLAAMGLARVSPSFPAYRPAELPRLGNFNPDAQREARAFMPPEGWDEDDDLRFESEREADYGEYY